MSDTGTTVEGEPVSPDYSSEIGENYDWENPVCTDPRVTKRRVTMRNTIVVGYDHEHGDAPILQDHLARDFVTPDFLDEYIAEAKTRWALVTVGDTPDAGPGGYDGPTAVPGALEHAHAGAYRPATHGSSIEAELLANGDVLAATHANLGGV